MDLWPITWAVVAICVTVYEIKKLRHKNEDKKHPRTEQ